MSERPAFVSTWRDYFNDARRAFREFLALPTFMIFLFVVLAATTYLVDRSELQFTSPIYQFFKARVFVDSEATSNLLGNIAGSIITVTSITITLLLLIVQQSASTMTTQVFDQFLRRRSNQFYFGFFVGAAVYTLITLATVDEPFNPVFSASLVFLFTVFAMFLLLVLFYSTIHQMRPAVILGAIHDHALSARRYQHSLLSRTRRQSQSSTEFSIIVRSDEHGFVTKIRLDQLKHLIENTPAVQEILLKVSIGSFVAYRDPVAEVKLSEENEPEGLAKRVLGTVKLERSRDLDADPDYGVTQLEQIAWAVLSPSKSNLAPGMQAIYHLRDLMARWVEDEGQDEEEEKLPVVYNDEVMGSLLGSFESLAVVAAVTQEHQVISIILDAFSSLYNRLPAQWQREIENSLARIAPTLSDYTHTAQLEQSLNTMVVLLQENGRSQIAAELQKATGA